VIVDCTGGGDFLTIQEGVDAAVGGDTVLIRPCVYTESVVVTGKSLTLRGSGAQVTTLGWSSPAWDVQALDINLAGAGISSSVESLAIIRDPPDHPAIYLREQTLVMSGCTVVGSVKVGTYYGEAHVSGSTLTQLHVAGGVRTSVISDSRIGEAYFSGSFGRPAGHAVMSDDSVYESVGFGSLVGMTSERDSIGVVDLFGGPDAGHYLDADGSTIEHLTATYSAYVELHGCTLGQMSYESGLMDFPLLGMSDCLVSGPFLLGSLGVAAEAGRASSAPYSQRAEGISLEHNTFLSDVDVACTWTFTPAHRRLRDNIVLGAANIELPDEVVISHNDFVGGASITTPSDSVFANLEADPMFCEPSAGDYTLEDCSPCAGTAHDGSDIGAFGIGCACAAVRRTSWGAVKAMFR